jgi:hypothetical protein
MIPDRAIRQDHLENHSANLARTTHQLPSKSILDVSAYTTKIKLTKQFRVPRDIAAILNAPICGGDYNAPKSCSVPNRGFVLVDAPIDEPKKFEKYINRNESERCLDVVRELQVAGESSIMLLTPVSVTPLFCFGPTSGAARAYLSDKPDIFFVLFGWLDGLPVCIV